MSANVAPPGGRRADLAPRWLEWALLVAALGLFVWRGLLPAWNRLLTDFPNYYLAGRLFREGLPLDRLYDWEWLQRQKDHVGSISRWSASYRSRCFRRCWLRL
jgi:hypothetical protein